MAYKQKLTAKQAEAKASLLEVLKPGDTVYTVLRHVSKSGMLRVIALYVIRKGELRWITYWAAQFMDDRFDRDREGIRVTGCGMDMGFSLVYNLGSMLWPDGVKARKTRRYAGYYPEGAKVPGGYALNQRWI